MFLDVTKKVTQKWHIHSFVQNTLLTIITLIELGEEQNGLILQSLSVYACFVI